MIDIFFFMMKFVLYPLLVIILLILGKELKSYYSLLHYKKQGLKIFYKPISGLFWYMRAGKNSNDGLARMRELVEENKSEEMLVVNSSFNTNPVVLLLGDEIIKEFMIKETDCSIKYSPVRNLNVGLFFNNGEQVHEARSSYSSFFNFDNLIKLSSSIGITIEKTLSEWKSKNLKKEEWTTVKVKDMLNLIFAAIVNTSLFGEDVFEAPDGKNVGQIIEEYINSSYGSPSGPRYLFVIQFMRSVGILPDSEERKKMYQQIEDKCWEHYQKRVRDGPKKVPNILDLMIARNEALKKQGKSELTKREIAGDFILFQFAGSDTTKETSTFAVLEMAKNDRYKQEMLKITDEIFMNKKVDRPLAFEDFNENERLNLFTMESMRLGNPVAHFSPRLLIKDVKIGKINFKAGARISVPVNTMHTVSKDWENPSEFNPDLMKKENLSKMKKTAYIPFGLGKRNCIGRNFGELVFKILLLNFFESIDVSHDKDCDLTKESKFTYGFVAPTVLMKLRSTK